MKKEICSQCGERYNIRKSLADAPCDFCGKVCEKAFKETYSHDEAIYYEL